jgi:Leucine-rich repeat (LRR) protein
MKKIGSLFLVLAMIVTTAACSQQQVDTKEAPTSTQTETQNTSTEAPTAKPTPEPAIMFSDPVLEAKVREAMGKPTGDITVEEAKAVLKLDLSNESFDDMNSQNGGIRDISDLKYFTGLEELNLSFNDISDFTPLAELKSIKSLGFTGVRPKDLSVLKGLTNMTCLIFDWTCDESQWRNGNVSLDFMADMKDLEIFSAIGGGIKDISALGGLTNIWSLFLENNAITDISSLSNLTKLKELKLSNNPIGDYSPLKDIYPKLEFSDFEMK